MQHLRRLRVSEWTTNDGRRWVAAGGTHHIGADGFRRRLRPPELSGDMEMDWTDPPRQTHSLINNNKKDRPTAAEKRDCVSSSHRSLHTVHPSVPIRAKAMIQPAGRRNRFHPGSAAASHSWAAVHAANRKECSSTCSE